MKNDNIVMPKQATEKPPQTESAPTASPSRLSDLKKPTNLCSIPENETVNKFDKMPHRMFRPKSAAPKLPSLTETEEETEFAGILKDSTRANTR